MERKLRLILLLVVTLLRGMPLPAWAQPTPAEVDTKFDALLKEKWTTRLEDEAKKAGLTVTDRRLTGTAEQKAAVYTAVVNALNADTTLEKLFDRAYIQALIDERTESRMPTSTNATSTNPATGSLPERSGSTALAALAADISSLVSADNSAVSFNLNALAFVTLTDPETFTELKNYQAHDFARRFSGTLVFGAKIPEKEITGLSNLPDFDKILDAFSWDVKVRVLGDKDPRSKRWQTLTVGKGGMLVQRSAVILTFIGVTARPGESPAQALEDITIVRGILDPQLAIGIAEIKKRIARSAQLSFKAAGTHLTKETGKNKYSYAALFDVGFGPSDFTANVQYSARTMSAWASTCSIRRCGRSRRISRRTWRPIASCRAGRSTGALARAATSSRTRRRSQCRRRTRGRSSRAWKSRWAAEARFRFQ